MALVQELLAPQQLWEPPPVVEQVVLVVRLACLKMFLLLALTDYQAIAVEVVLAVVEAAEQFWPTQMEPKAGTVATPEVEVAEAVLVATLARVALVVWVVEAKLEFIVGSRECLRVTSPTQ